MVLIVTIYTVVSQETWLIDYGGADNWSYVKYFHDWGTAPPLLRAGMDGDYKGARLPWIVPGYLFFFVFGSTLGSYLLHIGVLLVTTILFYLGTRTLFDDESAVIPSLIVLINPGFHASNITGFWYYHESAALLYYALACLGVVRAATAARPMPWLALAGFGLCCSLLTSLTYVAFLPAFGVFALILLRRFSLARLVLAGVAVLVGGLGAILLFGLLNLLVGGRFLFFQSQIDYTLRYTSTGGFWVEPQGWFHIATWLAFPLAVLVVLAAVALVRRSRGGVDGRCRSVTVGLLACGAHLLLGYAALLVFEVRGQPVLQVPYIAHQLFGPAVYAFAAILAVLGRRPGPPVRWAVVAAVVVGVILPVLLVPGPERQAARAWLMLPSPAGLPASPLWGSAALLTIGVAALAASVWSRWLVAVLAGSLLLGAGVAVAAPPGESYRPPPPCDWRKAQFEVIHQAARWATQERRIIGQALWYELDEQLTRGGGCPPVSLRPLYTALNQVTALYPASAPGVPPTPPGELPDPRVLAPEVRSWTWIVVASSAEHAPATRARFEAWLAGAPTPVAWRHAQAVELRHDDVAVTLNLYEVPKPGP